MPFSNHKNRTMERCGYTYIILKGRNALPRMSQCLSGFLYRTTRLAVWENFRISRIARVPESWWRQLGSSGAEMKKPHKIPKSDLPVPLSRGDEFSIAQIEMGKFTARLITICRVRPLLMICSPGLCHSLSGLGQIYRQMGKFNTVPIWFTTSVPYPFGLP